MEGMPFDDTSECEFGPFHFYHLGFCKNAFDLIGSCSLVKFLKLLTDLGLFREIKRTCSLVIH